MLKARPLLSLHLGSISRHRPPLGGLWCVWG